MPASRSPDRIGCLTIHKVSLIQLLPKRYLRCRSSGTDGRRQAATVMRSGSEGSTRTPRTSFAQMAVEPSAVSWRCIRSTCLSDEYRRAFEGHATPVPLVGRKLVGAVRLEGRGPRSRCMPTFWRPTGRRRPERLRVRDLVGIYDGADTGRGCHPVLLPPQVPDGARPVSVGQVGWYVVERRRPRRAPTEVAQTPSTDLFANSSGRDGRRRPKSARSCRGFAEADRRHRRGS